MVRATSGVRGPRIGRFHEEDVVHARTAKRSGALGAEHPGNGIDHVGLARPFGPTTAVTPGSNSKTSYRRRTAMASVYFPVDRSYCFYWCCVPCCTRAVMAPPKSRPLVQN